ncbi:MAG: FeoA family protein [Campylobacterota bacterium]|nr:FeoA family protein [Campylobacterota bacterium]
MKLSDLLKNQKATIVKVECSNELKQRFYSFGIIKGAVIEVEAISLAKNTIEILVEDTSIGIRVEEAKTIEVEII